MYGPQRTQLIRECLWNTLLKDLIAVALSYDFNVQVITQRKLQADSEGLVAWKQKVWIICQSRLIDTEFTEQVCISDLSSQHLLHDGWRRVG